MSRYKDQCIEVEEKFGAYLTNDGMTNQQAIVAIAEKYGTSHAFACATLLKEWNADETRLLSLFQREWNDNGEDNAMHNM